MRIAMMDRLAGVRAGLQEQTQLTLRMLRADGGTAVMR